MEIKEGIKITPSVWTVEAKRMELLLIEMGKTMVRVNFGGRTQGSVLDWVGH